MATAEVEVDAREALAAVRTLRRYARAQGALSGRTVPSQVNPGQRYPVLRARPYRVRRLRGSAGFLTVNDAPRLVSQLAAYLDQVGGRDVRSIYGHPIAAARLKERTPVLTNRGRGLLLRAGYLAAERP